MTANKYNTIKFALLLFIGMFAIVQNISCNSELVMTAVSVASLWCFSVSDICKRTISALGVYSVIVVLFLMKFYILCRTDIGTVQIFLMESMIVFCVLFALSRILRGKIGNGDFDIACIIYLCIGIKGMVWAFIFACMLVLALNLAKIIREHKKLKEYSIPLIPYLYIGYCLVLIIAKEMIFI